MKSILTLHQTLHGYDRGHTLLASSIELLPEGKRAMLVLSDMSGPRMTPGFESYLSFYPVPGTNCCAFARTWYAPEMPRPGCVWTHSLLIQLDDLDEISDLNSLQRLFVKPEPEMDLHSYNVPLTSHLSHLRHRAEDPEEIGREFVSFNLLLQLADKSFDSIVLPARNSQSFEWSVINLWELAWRSFRKTMTWCTGSIGGRSIDGRPFLIQVVPDQNVSTVLREIGKGKVISAELNDRSLLFGLHPDVEPKYNFEFNVRRFWEFASSCASDFSGGREEIEGLIEIFFEAEQHEASVEKLLDVVSRYYPEPNHAKALKRSLFGPGKNRLLQFDEERLVEELVTLRNAAICGSEELEVEQRAQKIQERNPTAASKIISKAISTEYNQHFYEFLRGVAVVITVEEMIDLCKGRRVLLSFFVSANPNLLLKSAIWKQPRDIQEEAIETVLKRRSELSTNYWTDLVRLMLSSEVGTRANRLIAEIGSPVLNSFFSFVKNQNHSFSSIPYDWRIALRSNEDLLQQWLLMNPEPSVWVMAVLAKSLSPTATILQKSVLSMWVGLAKAALQNRELRSDLEIMAFLLTLGFSNLGPGSEYLVSVAFEPVHDALDEDRKPKEKLSYESWEQLEPHLPSLGWHENWDKCERLRRALVQNFSENDWDLQAFLGSVEDQGTFHRLLKICKKSKPGLSMLSEIRTRIVANELSVTPIQNAELFKKKN